MKVGIGAGDLDGLVPAKRLQAELGTPMEFDKMRFAFFIDQTEAVYAKAFHHSQ